MLEDQNTEGLHSTKEFEFHPEGSGELPKDINSDMIICEFRKDCSGSTMGLYVENKTNKTRAWWIC